MEYEELYKKYTDLQKENQVLKIENEKMRKLLETYNKKSNSDEFSEGFVINKTDIYDKEKLQEVEFNNQYNINNTSTPEEKIKFFMSLFKGRNDVSAKELTTRIQ